MAQPPRPRLSEEQIRAMSPAEQARAIAEWSSYNARLKREREERETRGTFRGNYRGRGRGYRGRGAGAYHIHHPYPTSPYSRPTQTTPCPAFTATGVCKRTRCPHVHDPEKTAICKRYLFKDDCTYGDACSLSHIPSPHRSPNCLHFQTGNCNKDECRYAHVRVNPAAPVCEAFARTGFCEKGVSCSDRHVFDECPDFTNKGTCEVHGCRLPHIVHAGRLRQAAKSRPSSDTETPTGSHSPQDAEVEAISIGDDDIPVQRNFTPPSSFTQEADFVPFES